MAKEVTIHNQLNQIQEKSDKVMSNMQSILNTQGKMLEENAENLQAILINGHEEMEKSNNKTVKAVQEMQKSNVEELNQINNEIRRRKKKEKKMINDTNKKEEQETGLLGLKAKFGALLKNIIAALTFVAVTFVITFPVFFFFLS